MKVGAVPRTIITCLKYGFSFLHQDMKMPLKHNPSMAMAKRTHTIQSTVPPISWELCCFGLDYMYV